MMQSATSSYSNELIVNIVVINPNALRRNTIYRAYLAAKSRCQNKNHPLWKYYGGRGIKFNFTSYIEFYAELGNKPTPNHSLDRIDNDGHYEKGNITWSTKQTQVLNRRIQKNNTTNHKNIHWYKITNKWNVHIKRNNKQYNIGYFSTIEEAIKARDNFLKEL